MSIPYNTCLSLESFRDDPQRILGESLLPDCKQREAMTACRLVIHTSHEVAIRGIQLVRDTLRLVLKVPIRAVIKPIFLKKNWQELERAKVNVKLTGCALLQFVSIPVKFAVSVASLARQSFSEERANWLFEQEEKWVTWTKKLDGRASQLEALKEEGAKKAQNPEEFEEYRKWLYSIDPRLCLPLEVESN